MRHLLPAGLAVASAAMCCAAACAGLSGVASSGHPRVGAASAPVPEAPVAQPMIGVAGQSAAAWDKLTGVRASLSVSYLSMAAPVSRNFLRWAEIGADGARPVIEILPRGTTLRQVAAGADDNWLRSLKAEVGEPVAIAFAPEANGSWYAWGGHPDLFRAAWRHVWQVIGTRDVTWLWQMSARAGVSGYWPGRQYVTWAGLDGYFERPGATFATVFGRAVSEVRHLTTVPLLLTETAVGPLTGHVPADIRLLFAAASAGHLAGVVWFDRAQDDPPSHQDWLLTAAPGALAAFRQAAAAYQRAHGASATMP